MTNDTSHDAVVLSGKELTIIILLLLILIPSAYLFFKYLVGRSVSRVLDAEISGCGNLGSIADKYWCYYNLALKRDDITICNKILVDLQIRNYCMAAITRNSSFCANIRDEYLKQNCPPYW